MNLPTPARRSFRPALRLVVALSVLAIATGAPAAQARDPGSTPPAPVYGGTLTVRTAQPIKCLDPQQSYGGFEGTIFNYVVDSLITRDRHGRYWPGLALRWKYSNGGKAFTLFLRHGVRFSNGDPLDASTVKASIERAINPQLHGPNVTLDWGTLKSVRVVNKYTVLLRFDQPFRSLLYNLAQKGTGIVDAKAMPIGAARDCRYPVGTGPFKIANVAPAFSTVTLVRNDAHTWGVPSAQNHGKAYLSKVVFEDIDSDASAVSALLAGQLGMITAAPPSQLSRLQRRSDIKIYTTLSDLIRWVGFNFSHAPLGNVQVRRGIAEALDRNAILKVATNGLAKPALSILPVTEDYSDPSAKSYATRYDPSGARKLLAANHFTGPLTLLVVNDPADTAAAQVIQAELANVGVTVNLVSKPFSDEFAQVQKGDFDLTIFNWGYGDAAWLYSAFHSGQFLGSLMFRTDPHLDKLIEDELVNVKPAAAKKTLYSIQRYIGTNVIAVPLWVDEDVTAARSTVGGYHWSDDFFNPIPQDLYITK